MPVEAHHSASGADFLNRDSPLPTSGRTFPIEPELAHELLMCFSVLLMWLGGLVSSADTHTPGDEPYGRGFQTQFRNWIVGADRKIDRMAGTH